MIHAAAFAVALLAQSRLELSGGVLWTGGYSAGSAPATETSNAAPGSAPFTLFQTASNMRAAAGVDARLGFVISRRVALEGEFQFAKPTLRTHVSNDFESAAAVDAALSVPSYVMGGSLRYDFDRGRRLTPYAIGGAGYLRQIPDGGDVLTGAEVHVGGGVRYALTSSKHPLSLRAEARASSRSRSAGFDEKRRTIPAATAGIIWRF
jgi:opacity protein-like surface antigen